MMNGILMLFSGFEKIRFYFCIKIHKMFNGNFYTLHIMVKMMWIYVKKCGINSILKKLVCKIKKIKVGTFMLYIINTVL